MLTSSADYPFQQGGSGIAGVIKTILMLEKGVILPNFNFNKPNTRIPMQDWKIEVGSFARLTWIVVLTLSVDPQNTPALANSERSPDVDQ
jgi:hypothetical protein